jgi:hypothetical protein
VDIDRLDIPLRVMLLDYLVNNPVIDNLMRVQSLSRAQAPNPHPRIGGRGGHIV